MNYKLKNLNGDLTSISGTPIMDSMTGKPMTFRYVLIAACEFHRPNIPGEGIKAYAIGMKLLKAKDEIELNQEELDFLKTLVNNSTVLMSVVIGRINEFLEGAKESKVE